MEYKSCSFGLLLICSMACCAGIPTVAIAEGGSAARAVNEADILYLKHYVQRKYAPLFGMLRKDISGNQMMQLRDILLKREVNKGRVSINESQSFLLNELSATFGKEIVKSVTDYIETLPARRIVGELNQIFIYYDLGMSLEEINRLCRLLQDNTVELRTKMPNDSDFEHYLIEKKTASDVVRHGASKFLSPDQIAILMEDFELQMAFLRANRSSIIRR